MKKYRTLIILSVSLVVLLIALMLLKLDWKPDTKSAEDSICHLSTEEINTIRWTNESGTFSFSKSSGWWINNVDSSYPTDNGKIISLVRSVSELTAEPLDNVSGSVADFGLDSGAIEVEISSTSGDTFGLIIGDSNPISGKYYVRCENGSIYMAESAFAESFAGTMVDYAALHSPAALRNVTELYYSGGGREIRFVKNESPGITYTDEYVWFVENENNTPVDSFTVTELIDLAQNIVWHGKAAYISNVDQLKQYGLYTPSAELSLYDEQGSSFTIYLGSNAVDAACYYAMLDGVPIVYTIDETTAANILSLADYDLRPDEVCLIDMYTLTGVDIAVDGKEYAITADYTSGSAQYICNGHIVDSSGMASILSLLRTIQCSGFADNPDNAGKELLSVIFYRDAGQYSDMKMSFYEFGDSYCLVEFNGYNHIVVLRSTIDHILAYIDKLF